MLRTLGGEVADVVVQHAAVAVALVRIGRRQEVALLYELGRHQGNHLEVLHLSR